MKRRIRCAVFVAFASLATVPPASADWFSLDQSAWGHSQCLGCGIAIIGNSSIAQTFTAGRDGYLMQIDLGLYRSTPETATDVRLDLLPVTGLLDAFSVGDSLASTTIPVSQIPVCPNYCNALPSVSLALPESIRVTTGDQLAIVLSRPGGTTLPHWVIWTAAWFPGDGEDYTGGRAYLHEPSVPWAQGWSPLPSDYRFQTHVAPVPEPATMTLLLVGLAGLGARHLRLPRHRLPGTFRR